MRNGILILMKVDEHEHDFFLVKHDFYFYSFFGCFFLFFWRLY